MNETIEDVLKYCKDNNRICPMPIKWNLLYGMLKKKKRLGNSYKPSIPLILGAWHDTPPFFKQIRFIEHIRWANDQNQLEEISLFLKDLKETEWFHLGE